MERACHDGHIFIVNAVIINRWFQEMRVLFEPGYCESYGKLKYMRVDYHFGRFSGLDSILK